MVLKNRAMGLNHGFGDCTDSVLRVPVAIFQNF